MIQKIALRVILDSRGKETVAATVRDEKGNEAEAMAPSGTSRSEYEAVPFVNNSANESIKTFETYKSKIIGRDCKDQSGIDLLLHEIDGTSNFSKIGGNVATAISMANAKLAAKEAGMELYEYIFENFTKKMGISKKIPGLLGNVIGGGVHSSNKMSIQEILLATKAQNIMESAKANIGVHAAIGAYLRSHDLAVGLNIENAWNTKLDDVSAIELANAQAKANGIIKLGADCAASEFFKDGKYFFEKEAKPGSEKSELERNEYIELIVSIAKKYGFVYLEDPLDSNDFDGFSQITKEMEDKALVVGDDLYATNKERLKMGVSKKATNAILIKVNQVGTLTDVLDTISFAHKNGIKTIVSHRSGETTDPFMAHLGVAFGSEYIKCGILGGERIAKINELARIEEIELKNNEAK
ncbi:MAG: phosphopyruvate hydratase [Candidatus Micrarchaeia archaeon]